jgi:hypothetical protein
MFPYDYAEMRWREMARRQERINREAWKFHPLVAANQPAAPAGAGRRASRALHRIKQLVAERRPAVVPVPDLC